jgi:acetolactate synthase-1/2/3 large subunit
VLMTEVGESETPSPAQAPPASIGAGDPDALMEIARALVRSERPVVLTTTTGRTRKGFDALVRLAELLGLPVVERRDRTNFPTTHPLHQGFRPGPFVESADLVLVLDSDVPYIPTHVRPRADASIVQIDLDPVKDRIPLWSFPLTRAVRADTSRALEMIAGFAADLLTTDAKARVERRREELAARHAERRAASEKAASAVADARPIDVQWLASCVGQLQREAPDCVFVDESLTSNLAVWSHVDADESGTMFGSGGSALGWGLGAAVGIKLARPDRPVVLLVGDGSFVFGEPLAALWASQINRAPVLVVIFNNNCYNANKTPLVSAYPRGYSVRGGHFIGTDLVPAPRYDLLPAVVGAVGERVEDPREVLPALRRALEHVRSGRTAVLDVILATPGPSA